MVPYGYRKAGDGHSGGSVLTKIPFPASKISEAEVVRTIYRMAGVEKKSCQKIADHLNRVGVPCGSVANTPKTGNRKAQSANGSNLAPSHVRNMIVSRTYMGEHVFGKRARNRNRKLIVREVPAIVSDGMGSCPAGARLKPDNGRAEYSGTLSPSRPDQMRCMRDELLGNADEAAAKGPLLPLQRPPAGPRTVRPLRQEVPEQRSEWRICRALVWADIESFLRNPGEILERLRERVHMQDGDRQARQKELDELRDRFSRKRASGIAFSACSGVAGSTMPPWTSNLT